MPFSPHSPTAGQSVVQYLILLALILSIFQTGAATFSQKWLAQRIQQNLLVPLQATYQYGDPTVKGFDDPGGPVNHPRIQSGNNFRLFMNPDS